MYRYQKKTMRKPVHTGASLSTLCAAFAAIVVLLSSGCCGPMGCGPGCNTGSCFDCDGCGPGPIVASSPLDALRQVKRQMICGSGCGETYVGEWTSTPPDCVDPCCGDRFVGGAVRAQPFCWAPGTIRNGLRGFVGSLYGGRYCNDCGHGIDDCGCGEYGNTYFDGGFVDEGYIDGGYIDDGYMEGGVIGGAGCSTCQASASGQDVRLANRIRRPVQPAAQQASQQRAQRIRTPATQQTPAIRGPAQRTVSNQAPPVPTRQRAASSQQQRTAASPQYRSASNQQYRSGQQSATRR